jgi:hypothetical protein
MDSSKIIYFIAITVGSTLFSFIPALWGDGSFSIAGILLGTAGGIIGLVIAYKWMNA